MKINTRICDICGRPIYVHARQAYTLRKRFWELEPIGSRVDLCNQCYTDMVEYIQTIQSKNTENN